MRQNGPLGGPDQPGKEHKPCPASSTASQSMLRPSSFRDSLRPRKVSSDGGRAIPSPATTLSAGSCPSTSGTPQNPPLSSKSSNVPRNKSSGAAPTAPATGSTLGSALC